MAGRATGVSRPALVWLMNLECAATASRTEPKSRSQQSFAPSAGNRRLHPLVVVTDPRRLSVLRLVSPGIVTTPSRGDRHLHRCS